MNSDEPKKSHFGHFFLFFSLIFNFCLHFFFSQNLPILTEHDVSSHSIRRKVWVLLLLLPSHTRIRKKQNLTLLFFFPLSLSHKFLPPRISSLLFSERRVKKLMNGFKVKFRGILHFCIFLENSQSIIYIRFYHH